MFVESIRRSPADGRPIKTLIDRRLIEMGDPSRALLSIEELRNELIAAQCKCTEGFARHDSRA